jgi:branched-chain amino acid transport system ATP-binding protein
MKALAVAGLKKRFGGVAAVDSLSFYVDEGEVVGIIGPNGAGKTTVFNLLTGIYKPDEGKVEFFGTDITGIDSARPVGLGIARTFQNLRLFTSLTVLENVMVPILVREGYGPAAAVFVSRNQAEVEARARDQAREVLELFHLAGKADAMAGSLPYGEQRRVELARALAAKPRLLLIDEPGAGMNPREIQALLADIKRIKELYGLTVLMIEHQMGLVMRLSDRLVVMDFGRKISEGPPSEVKRDPEVIRAYLGTSTC